MHKTIYVTGITGFIGSNLLAHLLLKYQKVINFTRNSTIQIFEQNKLEEFDISEDFIQQNPSNILINLATLYQPRPNSVGELENLVEANILFPARVLNTLATLDNLKIINALSYHQLLDFPTQNVYSLSKELFSKFLEYQSFEIVSLYIFDTFGSRDTRNKVVDIFIKNILSGNPINIPVNEVKINLADVQPICCSLIKSINLKHGSYSLVSPDTLSLEALARAIMNISNTEVELVRSNIGSNYFDEIEVFPENIFSPEPSYSLQASLESRINELQDDL